jgi:ElaB/YqjD/DUF883 family membrane-anchored ribosome-binding protein
MYEKSKDASWEGVKTTTNQTVNRIVNEKVADAGILKTQTAEALEDAARKLRMADVSAQGEHVKQILQDVEDRVNQFKADVGAGYQSMEADYHKRAEPVEHMIADHPIPSVLIAAGIGALIGMLICKVHD